MSRGLGRTQRAILAALDGGKHGRVTDLPAVVYSTAEPTRAQRESVRRAVAHMEAAGLVTTTMSDEVFDLRGQREWNRIVRRATPATLSSPAPEQHLDDSAAAATLRSPGVEQHLDDKPMTPDRWTVVRAARKADHEAGNHVEFAEGCPPCEDDHGRHVGLEESVVGCASCEDAEEALNAKEEAEFAVRRKAERKAAREEARLRAAWLAANPEAIAWRCEGCEAEFTDEDADQGQGPLYECGECGTQFTRDNSADGDSNRCPDCNKFGAKMADLACPECGEGELEPIEADPGEQHLGAEE